MSGNINFCHNEIQFLKRQKLSFPLCIDLLTVTQNNVAYKSREIQLRRQSLI